MQGLTQMRTNPHVTIIGCGVIGLSCGISCLEQGWVTEIIARVKKDFNVDLDRDSIVSAMTKKVNSGRMFQRVEASTFAILNAEERQDP